MDVHLKELVKSPDSTYLITLANKFGFEIGKKDPHTKLESRLKIP